MINLIRNFKKNSSIRTLLFFKNTFYNFILIVLKIPINLLIIPLILSQLGKEKFGIWQTILSFVSFATLFNFGFGNGLRNLITQLSINGNKTDIGRAIGSTYIEVTKYVLLTTLVTIPLVYFFVEPEFIFANAATSSAEIKKSILIFLSFFLLNAILSLSDSVSFGLQKSYLTNVVQLSYLALSYIFILVFGWYYQLNLVSIAFIFGITQSVFYIISIAYQNKKFTLKISFKSKYDLKKTSRLSFNFFIAHFLAIAFLSIDNLVISSVLGPSQTTEFSIVNKVFFTLINLYSILLIHFWNSATEAFEKNELQWIFKTIKILFLIALGVLAMGLVISYFQKDILDFWIGKNILKIDSLTFYLFSIYTFFHCINAIFVNLQNGVGFLKIQILSIILALALYGLGCYLFDIKEYGYNVIIIIKIVVLALSVLINSSILKQIKTNGNLSELRK